jgi:hypothetical protein
MDQAGVEHCLLEAGQEVVPGLFRRFPSGAFQTGACEEAERYTTKTRPPPGEP